MIERKVKMNDKYSLSRCVKNQKNAYSFDNH